MLAVPSTWREALADAALGLCGSTSTAHGMLVEALPKTPGWEIQQVKFRQVRRGGLAGKVEQSRK